MTIAKQQLEPWLTAILLVARHYRLDCSAEQIRIQLEWQKNASLDELILLAARQVGLHASFSSCSESLLDPWRLPIVAELAQGQVGVIEAMSAEQQLSIQFADEAGLSSTISVQTLMQHASRILILRPESKVQDVRVDQYIKPYEKNWFWRIALTDWRRYADIVLASLVANILALAGIVFSMQVYDRVIPAQSIPTLWVLASGVLIAFIFEFILRVSRIRISDLIGKRADLRMSDQVFGHALRIKNSERSKSTGTFISQIRELENTRELITSTTITALADLPFFFLFLFILWLIGGKLVLLVLLVLPLVLIPGLLLQKPLAKLSVEGMRESAMRNAMLVETVQGIEDIKLLRAEPRFQNQWNHYNQVSANISMKQRFLAGLLTTGSQQLQVVMYAAMVLAGSFLVMSGEMTTGALVGASILTSRMLGPITQISSVMTRWQQAKVARQSLNELMNKPVDQPERAQLIHKPVIRGNYQLQHIEFKYNSKDSSPTLSIEKLAIKAGEKIAILGKNGAGKSTLLQLLSGMQTPQQGKVMLEQLDINLIDPADIRRDMSLLNQSSQLFFGTIRDNLILGAPLASDQDILEVLALTGAINVVQAKPEGLDYLIMEGGVGLSGGQRQSLLLARTLLRQNNILLLDEPTAWFDELSEKQLITRMQQWLGTRTMVVATHRTAVLALVDRVIVINDGKVVMDGPKANIMANAKQLK